MKDIEASISRYLVKMDTADRKEPTIAKVKTERLQDKIAALKEQMQILEKVEVQLDATPDQQVSLTDPDARSMKTRGTGVVGYNVQVAIDAKDHLIVAHEITNSGIDRDQLLSMATLARNETGVEKLTAAADRGYDKKRGGTRVSPSWRYRVRSQDGDVERDGSRSLQQRRFSFTMPRRTSIAAQRDSVSHGAT